MMGTPEHHSYGEHHSSLFIIYVYIITYLSNPVNRLASLPPDVDGMLGSSTDLQADHWSGENIGVMSGAIVGPSGEAGTECLPTHVSLTYMRNLCMGKA